MGDYHSVSKMISVLKWPSLEQRGLHIAVLVVLALIWVKLQLEQ